MSHWDRTFKMDTVEVDDYKATAQVWSAISGPGIAIANLDLSVDTAHGHASIRLALTSKQMHDIAFNLNVHANRLEELEAEAALLAQEAA